MGKQARVTSEAVPVHEVPKKSISVDMPGEIYSLADGLARIMAEPAISSGAIASR